MNTFIDPCKSHFSSFIIQKQERMSKFKKNLEAREDITNKLKPEKPGKASKRNEFTWTFTRVYI